MKVWVVAVGKAGAPLGEAIAEYETRASRYWPLRVVEVKAERAGKGKGEDEVREAEAERLLARVPEGAEVVALTREGRSWSSAELAQYLGELAVRSHPGPAFLIGGSFGLGMSALAAAQRQLSLSAFTLPHELARLLLAEQLYRAGTIARGEPYHKA